jgi:hypothetical protein
LIRHTKLDRHTPVAHIGQVGCKGDGSKQRRLGAA